MDRKDQYKHKQTNVYNLRQRRRQEEVGLRKQRRQQHVDAKRVRLDSEAAEEEYTIDQVCKIAKAIQKPGGDKLGQLKKLKRMFAQGSALIDAFLGVDNSFNALVGLLSGKDPALQLQAACCITNFSASDYKHCMLALQHAAPYLVTYLGGQNAVLQDQCSWALGNLAGDGPECRERLLAQGAVKLLVNLLKSPDPNVVRSAAFALSNLARGKEANTKALMDAGIAEPLLELLQIDADQGTMAEVAWTLTYLTAGGEFEQCFVSMGLIPKIIAVLEVLSKQKPHDSAVLTPLIRCLGNVCSGPENLVIMATEDGTLLPTIGRLLQSNHRHIKKETLWALSNMTEVLSVCQQVVSLGLIPKIVACLDTTYDIKREAVVCLCNLAYQGASFCQQLIQHGAFPGVISVLKDADPAAVGLVLGFSDMILKNVENSPDPNVVRSAAFALSNLARGKEANTKALMDAGIAEPLLELLQIDADQGTMAEVAWTLTYLTAGGEFEQCFVSMGLIPKIIAVLEVLSKQKPHDSAVLTPLIRCLGNVCSGPENLVIMATEDGTLLPTIGRLLQSNHRHIKKETLWALSNMTEVLSVCQQVVSLGLIPKIVACLDTTYDIKREAVVCLCNLAYQGASFCQQLIQHGAFPGVISVLKDADPAAVGLVLGFSDMILKNVENGKHLFEEHDGLSLLEPLEYHNNPTIHSQVSEFLETYFYHDEDKGS